MTKATLTQASLIRAKLYITDFTGASLREADLSGADLRGTNFLGADLSSARFIGAYLDRVIFDDANLQGADLIGASLGNGFIKPGLLSRPHQAQPIHKQKLATLAFRDAALLSS